jgi:D-aspartate ligase
MKKVVVLDGSAVQAIPVARSLKKHGFYTVLLCHTKKSYGYRTKYADEKIISPSVQKDMEGFHRFFLDLIQKDRYEVSIPMGDHSARYLSLYQKELRPFTSFIIPPYEVFMNGYDKNELMRTCRLHDFPHPRSFDLSMDKLKEAAEYIGFPALIKPNHTTGARGFAIVNSPEELAEKLPGIIREYGSCHLQEFIPPGGRQFKVELFFSEGAVINATAIHKMRFYPEKGGSSCFNQSVERKDLVDLCAEVLKAIKWEGFADFDLIEDPRDGVIKIMEINPRIPACIKVSFESGVDFAENIVQGSLGLPMTKYEFQPGSYLRYFGLDLLWFFKSNQRFKTKPPWFKAFLRANHFYQDGSLSDPLPFIYGTLGGLLKQLNPQFRASKKGMN